MSGCPDAGDNPYCLGSVLASALYEVSQVGENPNEVGQTIYEALSGFAEDWAAHGSSPSFKINLLLNRIIAAAGTNGVETYCTQFKKFFDDPNETGELQCDSSS